MIVVGWVCMVTGQSIALYSRLHLVDHDPSRLRFVLAMIITNVIISHVPVIIMVFDKDHCRTGQEKDPEGDETNSKKIMPA